MRKRPAIPRLDGGPQTVLLVADVERSVDFYAKKLLLELRDGDTARYAEFNTADDDMLVVVKLDGSIAPMAAPAETAPGATLAFTVEDDGFDRWKQWFARQGVAIERETKWVHGGRSLFVRDPDGRRIEFKTPPAVVAPKPTAVETRK